ncbi:MAG: hypothetical protein GX254_04140 [Clostridiales bacterium]|jgi:uncharacterized membrane protein|nr:hypothetical protein [Clostridiales bacterium]
MVERLREYIDNLFMDAPPTKKTVEMKEEILQNLKEKYHDLLSDGKSEEAAFNIAVAGIGDISELIEELKREHSGRHDNRSDQEKYEEKKLRAFRVSIAVALYILSIIPLLAFQNEVGVVFLAVLVAAATGILVYNSMTKPDFIKSEETIAEEFRQWRQSNTSRNSAYKSISAVLWSITLVVYFLISFTTRDWHITWLIFPIAFAVNNIIRVVMK